MVVLSRKPDQSIWIGNVKVTISRVQGQTVRVGIEAPKSLPIRRAELAPLGGHP